MVDAMDTEVADKFELKWQAVDDHNAYIAKLEAREAERLREQGLTNG